MTACPSCGVQLSRSPKFCPECGTRLEPTAPASGEVRKTVTVLFSDVVGSTAISEHLDAEAVRDLMARYFAAMRRAIERHGGTVEKFIGDAIMAVFGIPTLHEDDALRAVRAAIEMRDALAELNAEFESERGVTIQARTGITTGEVVTGEPSTGGTLATGDTVNTAARLEQAAGPADILIGAPTYRLVRDAVRAEAIEPVSAKGKELPVAAYQLHSLKLGVETQGRSLNTPLIGREAELSRLQQAYREVVRQRRCELFTLLGSAGVGKSRLVWEFLAGIDADARILRGRCLPYGEGITYWPLAEVMREAAAISDADDRETARGKLLNLLVGERDGELLAAQLASAIGLSDERASQTEVFWAVRRTLEQLARQRSLVVVWEDIHWAEPAFLDLIDHLADWSRDAPILLLCPARPELLDGRRGWGGGKLNATTVLLEALPPDAAARLIDALPGGTALPEALRGRIAQVAEGNPLFVEELFGMLVDDGVLCAVDRQWQVRGDVDRLEIPATISALLAARLERLTPPERQVAQRAAVVGRVFEADAVAELTPDSVRPQLPATLMALVRKELVRPERSELTAGDAFKFRHILIRDTAYGALPKRERAVLHERVADWLERVAGDRLSEVDEIIGYHLEQAHEFRLQLGLTDGIDALGARAAERLGAAGMRARVRQDARAALNLLGRALALLPEDAAVYPSLKLEHTTALLYAARHDEAIAAVAELERDPRTDPLTLGNARMLRIWARQNRELASLRPELAALLAAVRRDRPNRLRAEAWQAVGDTAQDEGDMRMAERAYDRMLAAARRSGEEEVVVDAELSLAGYGLRSPAAIGSVRALLEQYVARGTVGFAVRGFGLSHLALALAMEGRFEEARARLAERQQLASEAGTADMQVDLNAGLVELYAGHYDEARRLFRAARESLDAEVAAFDAAWLEVRAAEVASIVGDDEEALALTEAALARSGNNLWVSTLGGATRAAALARLGRTAEAVAQAADVLSRARAGHLELLPLILGTALERIAVAYMTAGRSHDARAVLNEALDMYERKGVVPFAARVRASLARVT